MMLVRRIFICTTPLLGLLYGELWPFVMAHPNIFNADSGVVSGPLDALFYIEPDGTPIAVGEPAASVDSAKGGHHLAGEGGIP